MKLFEVSEPYFAIVCAKDKQKCMDYYEKIVAGIEDREEFEDGVTELELTVAITKVANTISAKTKEPVGLHKASDKVFECLKSEEPCLLGLDGSLV